MLKYLRIVKEIKYAYDTRIITQVGRKDNVHTEGLHKSQRGVSIRRGRGTSKQSRQQSTDGVK